MSELFSEVASCFTAQKVLSFRPQFFGTAVGLTKKERGRSGEARGGGKWTEVETSDYFAELLYATTSPLHNLDCTRTCSATHVINFRVTVRCGFHNATEHKQHSCQLKTCSSVTRKLVTEDQRHLKNGGASALEKISYSHQFCFSVDLDRGAARVGRGTEKRRRKGGRKEDCSAYHRHGSIALVSNSCLETLVDQRLSSRRLPRRVLGRSVEFLVAIPAFESIITSKILHRSNLQPLVAR